ncbi:nucleotide sugar dehydrogenase [Candidatus Solincola tengchongensis]|uniref:nucleotide sugar dehydrogenase n=1 Tax=Candidatus Solincola tengchongensis TaxID=2900693 RepID=UPI00257E7C98|nr:nucleotide sugar dehydrogenase [Candidatus Solincola tengchongensis]
MGILESIVGRWARVGVIGLGYVGLPLAMEAAAAGYKVLGLEKEGERRARIAEGQAPCEGTDGERLRLLLEEGRLEVSGDPEGLRDCEVLCICVPTPLSRTRDPDLRYVEEASRMAGEAVRDGKRPKLVVLESTSYPGTSRQVVLPILEGMGQRACSDFHLAFSPERVDPGNARWRLDNTPKLLGGLSDCCADLAERFYGSFVGRTVRVSSLEVAEMAKLLENIFRGVNIALVNELWMLCDRMGLDVWEVIEAASTKPFGFMPFWPGPGLGGHCIPVDPFYLSWKAREYDFQTEFIELAGKVNVNMPYFVAGLVARALNGAGMTVSGSRILVLGVAYKPDVSDTRETPAAKLISLLRRDGAEVVYHDPHVPEFAVGGEVLRSVELTPETLRSCHCAVIVTDHSGVDYALVAGSGIPVVDTRNALRKRLKPAEGKT